MSNEQHKLSKDLQEHLADQLLAIEDSELGVRCEVSPDHWLGVCKQLRDHEAFQFEVLIDLCGVDYLTYGVDEWRTEDVSSTGFSRGVHALGPGRFAWDQRREELMPRRFAVVVQLLSLAHNRRLTLKCFAPDEGLLEVPSLVDIWPAANWFEREAFDLYGLLFKGHPDLRRILTDYGFIGHPFRKDFPLVGNVEVRYDEELQRVVYQPTEIEPRVTVPKTIRRDSRYIDNSPEQD